MSTAVVVALAVLLTWAKATVPFAAFALPLLHSTVAIMKAIRVMEATP